MTPKPKRLVDIELLKAIKLLACSVCGSRNDVDPSHIKTQGSGGPDTSWNVVPMCRRHHMEWHQYGPTKFLDKHPLFEIALMRLGWETEGKLWHPELSP